ncbi:MAG: pyridoxamine 5'-phosphate oxidase family protein [Actinomyces urogenitalis]|uniref:pyridoxamine 5'-phosphate oxidase family protein n=1 Tax=Actinomyces urogenitalis TaxID=103621 RepID=UPI002A7EEA8C|nr:pyridoxamine 5'-phosphate oxidase family protein [Actinomyces urogenitalis]MDY3679326.1 pyridoxamine 5'-phosphate oxidase family protein [Actinomyces urogenitalis]
MTRRDDPSAIPSLDDLLAPGRAVLLTTADPQGPGTRPVLLQPDPAGRSGRASVLAHASSRKVAQARAIARATLAGPTPAPHRGWFSIEADVAVFPAADEGEDVIRLDLVPTAARVWTVFSDAPRDNEVTVLQLAR